LRCVPVEMSSVAPDALSRGLGLRNKRPRLRALRAHAPQQTGSTCVVQARVRVERLNRDAAPNRQWLEMRTERAPTLTLFIVPRRLASRLSRVLPRMGETSSVPSAPETLAVSRGTVATQSTPKRMNTSRHAMMSGRVRDLTRRRAGRRRALRLATWPRSGVSWRIGAVGRVARMRRRRCWCPRPALSA
jgi:hypothetical protein